MEDDGLRLYADSTPAITDAEAMRLMSDLALIRSQVGLNALRSEVARIAADEIDNDPLVDLKALNVAWGAVKARHRGVQSLNKFCHSVGIAHDGWIVRRAIGTLVLTCA